MPGIDQPGELTCDRSRTACSIQSRLTREPAARSENSKDSCTMGEGERGAICPPFYFPCAAQESSLLVIPKPDRSRSGIRILGSVRDGHFQFREQLVKPEGFIQRGF